MLGEAMQRPPSAAKLARKKRKLDRDAAAAEKKQKRRQGKGGRAGSAGADATANSKHQDDRDPVRRVAELAMRQLLQDGHAKSPKGGHAADISGLHSITSQGVALAPLMAALARIALDMSHLNSEFCARCGDAAEHMAISLLQPHVGGGGGGGGGGGAMVRAKAAHFGKLADAAFSFALAGCRTGMLFERLAALEISLAPSVPNDVGPEGLARAAAALAVAGVRGDGGAFAPLGAALRDRLKRVHPKQPPVDYWRKAALHSMAAELKCDSSMGKSGTTGGGQGEAQAPFCLHSDEAAMHLWRHSATQHKRKGGHGSCRPPAGLPAWGELFDDPTLPLVLDVGCGFGVSLLGLAAAGYLPGAAAVAQAAAASDGAGGGGKRGSGKSANFLGCDLSAHACSYASGIAQRWGLRCAFVFFGADECIEAVRRTYPGSLCQVMVQFPTPFASEVSSAAAGNSQLPSKKSAHFMGKAGFLARCADALAPQGTLFIQSNVEDVAIAMKSSLDSAAAGLEPVLASGEEAATEATVGEGAEEHVPRRRAEWVAHGGERAAGPQWLSRSILPTVGRTETEVMYESKKTRVHRAAWTKRPPKMTSSGDGASPS